MDDRTRFMAYLATLLGCQGIDEFRAILPAALNMGVTPVEEPYMAEREAGKV